MWEWTYTQMEAYNKRFKEGARRSVQPQWSGSGKDKETRMNISTGLPYFLREISEIKHVESWG